MALKLGKCYTCILSDVPHVYLHRVFTVNCDISVKNHDTGTFTDPMLLEHGNEGLKVQELLEMFCELSLFVK